MKILLIGNADSFWIKEYIEYILLKESNDIFVVSKSVTNKDFKKFYDENNINILNTDKGTFLFDFIPRLRTLINMKKKVKKEYKKGKFDVVHIHSVPSNFMITFLNNHIVKYAEKVICTYWGSDLLSKDKGQLRNAIPCLNKAKYISYSSDGMDKYFHDVFGDTYNNKIVRAKFGISIYDVINQVKKDKSKEECKEFFGINKNKTSVAIGYNGNIRQHHLDVLKEIGKLEDSVLSKINIVIQLSYGLTSNEYKSEILDSLSKMNVEYTIIEDFLNKEHAAMLRLATDVFIHAQDSDAFSASIQECVYSGSILLNPSWIIYKEFDDLGIDYIIYNSFSEINRYLRKVINKEVLFDNTKKSNLLYNKYSWHAVKNDWEKLYL
ncbi:glycosyltransferase [Anaerofustis sp.]|uniref:glycosyltransferase n=1 Tax=Anaerofustis sp. TaxID=1872517 RepID=UPI0025BFEF0F|nr:glycosyltransferase [Anaerofustis sp.]